jgi:hypothetical protein
MARLRSGPGTAVVGVAAIAAAGCTILGALGGTSKTPTRETRPVAPWDLVELQTGTRLELTLRDGGFVGGTLREVKGVDDLVYAGRYQAARDAAGPGEAFPALGPGARLRATGPPDGAPEAWEIVGFEPGSVILRARNRPAAPFRYGAIDELVDGGGQRFTASDLERLDAAGRLPSRRNLMIRTDPKRKDELRAVPLESVALARASGMKSHVGKGALIGALIDVTVVGIAIAGLSSEPAPTSSGSTSSCPYVYSHDGSAFVLDAEPFGGSFVSTAQRSDRVRLRHLKPEGGRYRLRVANELAETDYLDELKLLVVDHAPGWRAVPDVWGRHHLVGPRTVAPASARDLRGAIVTRLVESADGRSWQGSPVGRRPERPEDLRDGLELAFPRPAGARDAVLVLELSGTPWGPELVKRLLSLQGRELGSWYERVSSEPGRARGLDALAYRAAPAVRLWTSGAWIQVDVVAELPTATRGEQAVRLDLRGVEGDVVRVRLDGLVGIWRLDAAALDFEASTVPPASVVELAATTATTSRGEDGRAALRAIDRERLVIEPGERLDAEFVVPPPAAGLERSVVLKATGYYRLHLEPEGAPRTAEFERLVREPDAFARFALEQAQADLQAAAARGRTARAD